MLCKQAISMPRPGFRFGFISSISIDLTIMVAEGRKVPPAICKLLRIMSRSLARRRIAFADSNSLQLYAFHDLSS